jgi:hypothetical protein
VVGSGARRSDQSTADSQIYPLGTYNELTANGTFKKTKENLRKFLLELDSFLIFVKLA